MANVQLVSPNIHAEDATGMCLRFTQRVYWDRNPYFYASAWEAWVNAKHKRYGALPEDVAVPVYFEHWGTYGSPPQYANWGHIAVRFPGGGVLSSPAYGYGQQWFPSIAAVEQAFNARYVGWAYDVGGLMVADVAPGKPNTPPKTPTTKPNWEDTLKAFSGKNLRKTKQTIKGGAPAYVTFRDSHDAHKLGDRTIARGPGYIVGLTVNVTVSGPKDARFATELVKETGANKQRVRLANPRFTIDSYGREGFQIAWSGYLGKGELIRLLIHPEKGKNLKVEDFYWSGMNRPGAA